MLIHGSLYRRERPAPLRFEPSLADQVVGEGLQRLPAVVTDPSRMPLRVLGGVSGSDAKLLMSPGWRSANSEVSM